MYAVLYVCMAGQGSRQVVQGHIDRQGGALAPAAVDSGSEYKQGDGRGQWI